MATELVDAVGHANPAMQAPEQVADVRPEAAPNVPAGHKEHEPEALTKLPAGQAEQTEAPANEVYPEEHGIHDEDAVSFVLGL